MAKVDIKGPSADEDFDVKADEAANTSTTDTSTDTSSEADTSSTSTDTVDSSSSAEESKDETPEETTSESDSSSSESSEEAPAEETSEPEPAAEETTDTASEPEPATPEVSAATVAPAAASSKGSSNVGRTIFEIILVAIIIGLAIWGFGLKSDRDNLAAQVAKQQADPQALVQKQADAIITRVGKLMNLPTNETPTIANVTDANAAKQQSAFFNNAQNGDKVLMYVKSGEAILYRPSTNKIILVAPLTFNNGAATTGTTR